MIASRGAMAVTDWNRAVSTHFLKQAGDPPWPPGMDKIDQLDLEMHARDATVRELGEFRTESDASINDLLANLEDGIWSACWAIDASTRRRAAVATREWARGELGHLDAPRIRVESSVWRVYTLS